MERGIKYERGGGFRHPKWVGAGIQKIRE